jgi:hypothetical protein
MLKEPLTFPAGTRMHCVAYFDNSEHNPSNPDPTQAVNWGEQSWDEMMIGYFDIAVPMELVRADEEQGAETRAAAIIKRYDINKNGQVERDERPRALSKIFDQLDQNGDKVVTEEELKQAAKRFPKLR